MAFVYSVVDHGEYDPLYEIVGIVCREDIIDSMLTEEVGFQEELKESRQRNKERLARLFSDHHVGTVLNDSEIRMICKFL